MKLRLTTMPPLARTLTPASSLAVAMLLVFGCTATQTSDQTPTGGQINLGDGQEVVVEQAPNAQGEKTKSQTNQDATAQSRQQGQPGVQQTGQNGNQGVDQVVVNPNTTNNRPPQGGNPPPPRPDIRPGEINLPVIEGGEDLFEPTPEEQSGRDNQGAQCSYARAQDAGGAGFGLTSAGGYIPPSVIIRMTVMENGKTKTRRCVGVLGVKSYQATVDGEKKILYFPRVSMAKHCAATDGLPVVEVLVADVAEAQNKTDQNGNIDFDSIQAGKKASYSVDESYNLINANGVKEWFVDWEGVSHSFPTVRATTDSCSVKAKDNGLDIPCFTSKTDRINVIMEEERQMLRNFKKSDGEVVIDNYDPKKFYGNTYGAIDFLVPDANNSTPGHQGYLVQTLDNQLFDWQGYYMSRRVKVIDELELSECDLKINGQKPYTNAADVIQCWDKTLRRIQPTQLVKGHVAQSTTNPIELRPGQSWGDVIEVFPREPKADQPYTIEAIGLLSNPGFKEGHSGTILVGEFIRAELAGAIEIYSSKRIIGSLSTVKGEPVCTGDDLQCCEKID